MDLKIDHKSPVPLYIQVELLLRKLIEDPEYQNGKYLPSEIILAKELAISRSTIRLSMNKLVYEGLVTRKKRYGTKVANSIVSSKSKNWLNFSQEMEARGISIKTFELHISWEHLDERLANFFEMGPRKKILKLERLRGNAESPFVYSTSYFHPRVDLTGKEDFNRPLHDILEKDCSIVVQLAKEEISAKAADDFTAKKLDIEPGSPILCRRRYIFDHGERPIEYNLEYYKADSFIYTVESRLE